MIVLANAKDVRTAEIYDGQVTYKLYEPYPGENSINEIRRRLRDMNWRPRDRDLLNPSLSYAITAKWRRVQAEKGDLLGWAEQWENAAGDVVVYGFSYMVTDSGADPGPTTPMEVHSSYFLASTVAAIEREPSQKKEP